MYVFFLYGVDPSYTAKSKLNVELNNYSAKSQNLVRTAKYCKSFFFILENYIFLFLPFVTKV